MLIGLIMYISIFKAEIGSKLRPRSPLQAPMFTFEYGQSFCLFVAGFILTEAVGVLNVFLFIGLQQQRVVGANADAELQALAIMPCFSVRSMGKPAKSPNQMTAMVGQAGSQMLGLNHSPEMQKR